MSKMNFNNTFGAIASANGFDLQRSDLWKVTIPLPQVLRISWQNNVEFLLEKFPFPARERDMIEVKYMQQTNFLIGRDAPTPAIEIPVRYAFGVQVAEALEKWYWLVSNPKTGGVGLTTQCKARGVMRWMVPNMQRQVDDIRGNIQPGDNTLDEGLTYVLEGCIIKGLKFSDADMTQSNFVNLLFTLQIDRYYPDDVNNMVINPVLASA
jgi:hypothetical protein